MNLKESLYTTKDTPASKVINDVVAFIQDNIAESKVILLQTVIATSMEGNKFIDSNQISECVDPVMNNITDMKMKLQGKGNRC